VISVYARVAYYCVAVLQKTVIKQWMTLTFDLAFAEGNLKLNAKVRT